MRNIPNTRKTRTLLQAKRTRVEVILLAFLWFIVVAIVAIAAKSAGLY